MEVTVWLRLTLYFKQWPTVPKKCPVELDQKGLPSPTVLCFLIKKDSFLHPLVLALGDHPLLIYIFPRNQVPFIRKENIRMWRNKQREEKRNGVRSGELLGAVCWSESKCVEGSESTWGALTLRFWVFMTCLSNTRNFLFPTGSLILSFESLLILYRSLCQQKICQCQLLQIVSTVVHLNHNYFKILIKIIYIFKNNKSKIKIKLN